MYEINIETINLTYFKIDKCTFAVKHILWFVYISGGFHFF